MKKILKIFVVFCLLIFVAGCTSNKDTNSKTTSSSSKKEVKMSKENEENYPKEAGFVGLAYEKNKVRYWYITDEADDGLTKETIITDISRVKNGKIETYSLANPEDGFFFPTINDIAEKSDKDVFDSAKRNGELVFNNEIKSQIETLKSYSSMSEGEDSNPLNANYQKAINELENIKYETYNDVRMILDVKGTVETDETGNNVIKETIGGFPTIQVTVNEEEGSALVSAYEIDEFDHTISGEVYKDFWLGLATTDNIVICSRDLGDLNLRLDNVDEKNVKEDK